MPDELSYNPLDKKNLGHSVAEALLARPLELLPPIVTFNGAGIYVIYYIGNFPTYTPISTRNLSANEPYSQPIYVGKAVPEGARKGGYGLIDSPGPVLFGRLREHAASIGQADNLQIEDFRCRYLVVDDIWIPLAESLLIKAFQPVWNLVVEGFGNHDPGSGRYQQKRSAWDVVHPGRSWAIRLQNHGISATEIISRIESFLQLK